MGTLLAGALMGLGATAAMDVWALILARTGVQPHPNWAIPGRWLGHVFRGRMFHDDIGASDPVGSELRLGWVFHYGVGVIYGIALALILGPAWLAAPSFLPAWIFAILTIAAGWFLLQPGMGLGWAGSNTPSPWRGRIMGLLAHTVFGIGLWGTAILLA